VRLAPRASGRASVRGAHRAFRPRCWAAEQVQRRARSTAPTPRPGRPSRGAASRASLRTRGTDVEMWLLLLLRQGGACPSIIGRRPHAPASTHRCCWAFVTAHMNNHAALHRSRRISLPVALLLAINGPRSRPRWRAGAPMRFIVSPYASWPSVLEKPCPSGLSGDTVPDKETKKKDQSAAERRSPVLVAVLVCWSPASLSATPSPRAQTETISAAGVFKPTRLQQPSR
jgi:hypothetical protein